MVGTPDEVLHRELNEVMQSVLTWVSWGLVAVMIVIAWRMCVRERTPFYLLVIAATGVAAFAEPLYDVAFDLWFYDAHANGEPGAMWSHFTAFDIVQPNWSHSGYVILYANMTLYAARRILAGTMDRRMLFAIFGIEFLTSCVFEMIAINGNAYTYWGPHQLRVFDYPLVIGALEACQVVLFTVLACALRARVRHWSGLLLLFVLFPITFFGANFGVGAATIIALHVNSPESTAVLVTVASLLSIAGTLAAVYAVSLFLTRIPVASPDRDYRTRSASSARLEMPSF